MYNKLQRLGSVASLVNHSYAIDATPSIKHTLWDPYRGFRAISLEITVSTFKATSRTVTKIVGVRVSLGLVINALM
jgi:hypothetical protein